MTAILYFLVAVSTAGLATRTWLGGRADPARRALLGLGWCIALAYLSFSLSLLPGLDRLRLLYMAGGLFIPAFTLWTVDRLFSRDGDAVDSEVRRTFGVTALLSPLLTAVQGAFFGDSPRASPVEVVAGLFIVIASALPMRRIQTASEATPHSAERVRLRYLLAVVGLAVAFTGAEQAARGFGPALDVGALPIASRVVALQGPIPPVSTLLVGLAFYFLYQMIVMYRLLDLQELLARITTLTTSALLLLLVDGLTGLWVGTFTDFPIHTTFQIFLASVLFLAAYDPLREQISAAANRLFHRRGALLEDALARLGAELPTVISARGVTDTLLARLHSSGRAPVCSVYLWDRSLDAFSCSGVRGQPEQRPLAAVAAHAFTAPFEAGEPWLLLPEVERRVRQEPALGEVLALMRAMNATLTVPLVSPTRVVLGWVHLRDEEWSDGYSAEEILRLRQLADLAAVSLSNIEAFRAMEEAQRLAALGAMAAGLAHEIRNPLAGIKGAAQFLQSSELPEDTHEMLGVVVEEANRLNLVVGAFLDYARPTVLQRAPEHVNALVSHTLAVVRAQKPPAEVRIVEDLGGDLPHLQLDGARVTQVLLNLVQNGVQAMPHGGTLTVTTRLRRARGRVPVVEIAVADNGVGLAPEVQEKLFIPFFTTKRDGTGLGLALCKRLVQEHGGEIEVKSVPGVGTTFFVRFAASAAQEATEEGHEPAEPPR